MQLAMINNFMHACMLKDKTDGVSKDSPYFKILKCFVAQTIGPIEKSFSHKRFIATRSSKQDSMLVCFDDFIR